MGVLKNTEGLHRKSTSDRSKLIITLRMAVNQPTTTLINSLQVTYTAGTYDVMAFFQVIHSSWIEFC